MVSGASSATMAPPSLPPLRSQVDDPVGGGDDVEVVLDDDHRLAAAMSRSTMPSRRSLSAGPRSGDSPLRSRNLVWRSSIVVASSCRTEIGVTY